MRKASEVVYEMYNDTESEIKELNHRITSLQQKLTAVDNQINAIKMCIINHCAAELQKYLINKISSLTKSPAKLKLGPNFNKIEFGNWLDDWKIIDTQKNTIYQYKKVNWDNDPVIIELMETWECAVDYLTRPLNTGATYGLFEYRKNIQNGLNILNENKSKIVEMREIFKKYKD